MAKPFAALSSLRHGYLVLLLCLLAACSQSKLGELRNGDIIFQTSTSSQSQAIQLATRSKYSHVGIVFMRAGEAYVFEAKKIVGFTPLAEWVARGVDSHYVVKRLNTTEPVELDKARKKMPGLIKKYRGRPYDFYFEWSDEKIYCSELVWKIYDEALRVQLGQHQRLREFDLQHPLVQAKLRERFGSQIPLDELVISPAAIFASDQLATVRTH
jgi:hypothetical protein